MDAQSGPSGDAAQRQRLVRILRDPDEYFAQARREAREHAQRLITEQLDAPPER